MEIHIVKIMILVWMEGVAVWGRGGLTQHSYRYTSSFKGSEPSVQGRIALLLYALFCAI